MWRERTIDLLINDLGEPPSDWDCVQRIQIMPSVFFPTVLCWVASTWFELDRSL